MNIRTSYYRAVMAFVAKLSRHASRFAPVINPKPVVCAGCERPIGTMRVITDEQGRLYHYGFGCILRGAKR